MAQIQQDDAAGVFWPAYVDAISNLVLNLLFLTMILAIAVFVLASQIGQQGLTMKKAVATHDQEVGEVEARAMVENAQAPVRKEYVHVEQPVIERSELQTKGKMQGGGMVAQKDDRLPQKDAAATVVGGKQKEPQQVAEYVIKPSPEVLPDGSVKVLIPKNLSDGVLFEIHFSDDAGRIPEAVKSQVRSQIRALAASGIPGWRVVVATDTAYAITRRAAFLRVLAVRELLDAEGISPDVVETQIQSGGSAETAAIVRVFSQKPAN